MTCIIAEAGVNHNGSIILAKQLIDAAKEAGADVIKFQTFQTDLLVDKRTIKAEYQNKSDSSLTQYEMIKKLELSQAAFCELKNYAKQKKIKFLSTPDEKESLNFLVNNLNLDLLKISSGEITNSELLLNAARTGRKIILSTGMANLGEIEQALSVLAFGYLSLSNPSLENFRLAYESLEGENILKEKVILLHCTTEYPAPPEEVNLRAMLTLNRAFGLPVGFSDHTLGSEAAVAATALGAVVIEKHLTLDNDLPGPDHKASLNPDAFKQMVQSIRLTEKILGSGIKKTTVSERKNKNVVQKSLIAKRNILQGELFTEENLTVKRLGKGISALYYWDYIGKKSSKDYKKGEYI